MKKILLLHFLLSISLCVGFNSYVTSPSSGLLSLALFGAVFLVLWLLTFLFHRLYFFVIQGVISLAFYFLKELIVANMNMIYYIISPGRNFSPAILEFPLRLQSKLGIILLANLITLTPGTITLEVSQDKKHLYFHIINVPDQNLERAKQKVRNGFEKRIMRITS